MSSPTRWRRGVAGAGAAALVAGVLVLVLTPRVAGHGTTEPVVHEPSVPAVPGLPRGVLPHCSNPCTAFNFARDGATGVVTSSWYLPNGGAGIFFTTYNLIDGRWSYHNQGFGQSVAITASAPLWAILGEGTGATGAPPSQVIAGVAPDHTTSVVLKFSGRRGQVTATRRLPLFGSYFADDLGFASTRQFVTVIALDQRGAVLHTTSCVIRTRGTSIRGGPGGPGAQFGVGDCRPTS